MNWDGNDFRNSQDSSGTVADNISRNGNLQQGYEHGSLTKGLVAYYPMEKGQGEIVHDGALENLGRIEGASWNSGKIGNYSLELDGIDDEITLGKNLLNNRNIVTISFWILPKELPDYIISEYDSSGGGSGTVIYDQDQNNEIKLWIDGDQIAFPYTWDIDAWQHITLRFDNGAVDVYVDGSLLDSKSHPKTELNSTGPFRIDGGKSHNTGNMIIDDVRIYNRALSRPEIEALANISDPSGVERTEKSVPGQSEGGISRYKFDGDATDTWGDNHGTENGNGYTTGVYGQAAKFNGSSDYINTGITDFPSRTELTVSAWIYAEDFTDGATIISKYDAGSDEREFLLNVSGEGDLRFYVMENQDVYNSDYEATDILSTGKWVHVVGAFKSDEYLRIYKDGRMVAKSLNTPTNFDNTTQNISLGAGREGTIRYWNGKIDDVRIYDEALTPVQIEKLYHKGAYRISR